MKMTDMAAFGNNKRLVLNNSYLLLMLFVLTGAEEGYHDNCVIPVTNRVLKLRRHSVGQK